MWVKAYVSKRFVPYLKPVGDQPPQLNDKDLVKITKTMGHPTTEDFSIVLMSFVKQKENTIGLPLPSLTLMENVNKVNTERRTQQIVSKNK